MALRHLSTILVILVVLVPLCFGFLGTKFYPNVELANVAIHEGLSAQANSQPLFLTPYIEAGKLKEGRELSEVRGLPGPQIKSFSGYLTVNKTYNSNLFFWFFPALSGKTDVPVVLWLQGGPGASSLYGLFAENGPLEIDQNGDVHLRNYTWNREFAMLYIDNPVGTGFSFTDDNKGYARNEDDVASNLYEGLKQFFTLYEDYRGKPFYATGESYAGKYVPAISHKIHTEGEAAKQVGINLKGIAIGDGWCDPRNMLNYGAYLYQIGLIDELQRDHFYTEQDKIASYIDNGDYVKAFHTMDNLMDGDLTKAPSYFTNVTGLNYYMNILDGTQPKDQGYYIHFLGLTNTRNAIHVGNLPYNQGNEVEEHLLSDVFKSVKHWVEVLLNAGYPTLIYSGQLDIIVAAPLTENFLAKLNWKGANKYINAQRFIYKVNPNDSEVAGYVRHADNLIQIVVRNAGHILPFDQPRVAYDMITRFVTETDNFL